MASLKDRFKAKFGRKEPPITPPDEAPSPSITPQAQSAPDTAISPDNLPDRLWNQAYDLAKTGDSSTVDAYEKLLSARLSEQDAGASTILESADLTLQRNQIAHDAKGRQVQMQQLVQNGLHRTEKAAKVKQGIEGSLQATEVIRDVVSKAVQASPQAAVAWVGVCFALELLMNPLTQASSNRQGIAYVVSRMDWYWNLSSLLLDENMTKERPPGLHSELEMTVTQLYSKLLLYQMKSVCYCHRKQFSVFLRDLIKLDDWGGELSDIQAAEAVVQADSAQYNTLRVRARLDTIAETAKSQNMKLDSISLAIREQTKQQEKMYKTSADNTCLADLRLTDPRDDKKRIEETKGGLLKNSYYWILDNLEFQQWRDSPQNQLLWVKADPGKGKTMLLCGIIDELQKSMGSTALLSFFFCQATDLRINNATAVLRGLMYLLVDQQPSLISHLRKKHDHAGKSLFEDANAWVAMSDIFTNMLKDPNLSNTYIVVDALDECVDLPKLLDLIVKQSSAYPRVKWLVSSRNWPTIEEQLEKAERRARLSLELNADSVSAAVGAFIQHNVMQLAQEKKYDDKTKQLVQEHLSSNANGTFLWVALVCQVLRTIPKWKVPSKLTTFPSGLDSLYGRMMSQINSSDDADLCKQMLASIAVAYRPLKMQELACLVELENLAYDLESLRDIIGLCGSFLTIQDGVVYLVHQSAKDYLIVRVSNEIFPSGREDTHYTMFFRSLRLMSSTLRRDMYNLGALGYPIEWVESPERDPLATVCYSCVYWVDHLEDSNSYDFAGSVVDLQDGGALDLLLREKYLYWLEALSLCKNLTKGVASIAKLEALVQGRENASALAELVRDAHRFILSHGSVIENSPLQAYSSALLFSPTRSLIRNLFIGKELDWITVKPTIENWSACLQTLESGDAVRSVAFSKDSAKLASGSFNGTVKVWDANTGGCLLTLKGHNDIVSAVTFSHDCARLASASKDRIIKIWDCSTGECLQTLKGHSDNVHSVAFSHDSARLASSSHDHTVKIWNSTSSECLLTLNGHTHPVSWVLFSHNSARLGSVSQDGIVKFWDSKTGDCLRTLESYGKEYGDNYLVALSYDFSRVASTWKDDTLKIWDISTGKCLQKLGVHDVTDSLPVFSHDSTRIASISFNNIVQIWDVSTGECLQTFKGHTHSVLSVAFSYDLARLASGSYDQTIKVWDAGSSKYIQTLDGLTDNIRVVVFSKNLAWLASASGDYTVKIWDTSTGECLHTLDDHDSYVWSVAFSYDSGRLASGSYDGTVRVSDVSTGKCLLVLIGHDRMVFSVVFSYDSERLASASSDRVVRVWDANTGELLQIFRGHDDCVNSVVFSHDSAKLASGSNDNMIKIWDTNTSKCLQTLKGHSDYVRSVAFSYNSAWLVSSSGDRTVKIWDSSTSECLHSFEVSEIVDRISLDGSNLCLSCIDGSMDIYVLPSPGSLSTLLELQRPEYQGLALSAGGVWVKYNSECLVWLPSDYRSLCSVASGNMIAIGCKGGRVYICEVRRAIS